MSLHHEQRTGNILNEKVDQKSYIDYVSTLHHNPHPSSTTMPPQKTLLLSQSFLRPHPSDTVGKYWVATFRRNINAKINVEKKRGKHPDG